MSNRTEQPVDVKPGSRGGTEERHPAFGVAAVHRRSGTTRSLFQSDVLHHETISLSISTAKRGRDLSHDWVHPEQELIEIEMSLAQWGAVVSSVGIGSGVPVTIRRTESEAFVPELPYEPRFKTSLDEVNGTVAKLLEQASDTLAAVEDAIDNKKGAKAIREALRMHHAAIVHAEKNAEFAIKSMVSAGEKVTSQVRADIESQILAAHRIADASREITAPEMTFGEIEK